MIKKIIILLFSFVLLFGLEVFSQSALFTEDFESGTASADWGLYRENEENVMAVTASTAPITLGSNGEYIGYLHDADASYNGAAIALAGETSLQNYSIEGEVYCYVNNAGGSAYTGLVVYADSATGTYIKLTADFDGDQRLRFYNNHLDMATFQYTFHHSFGAADIPGGVPAEDGWHKMKVEVQTINDSTTAFWCYFDGELLAGCPIYDTSVHQMDSGQFGIYAFQMDADGIEGYFDNIIVKPLSDNLFAEDFETGFALEDWGLYRAEEENVVAVAASTAPVALEGSGEYIGYLHDADATYNGAAIALAGETDLQDYSIEGDVYCYVNNAGGSAYTGLVVYADSAAGTYIKLTADFDGDQRLRFYNNHLDMTTFQYTFHHSFGAADIPGGIPTEDGWHHMKIEVKTINDSTTAFWCYFDGEELAGCPLYDTSVHQMDAGQFGIYAFQMDTDGIEGYFDNIVVKKLGEDTAVEQRFDWDSAAIVKDSHLLQNYPNPFNPQTAISFSVLKNEFVDLTIYDLLGRKIQNLVAETKSPGCYNVVWQGVDESGAKMPSGVYVYMLKTKSFQETRKMMLMK